MPSEVNGCYITMLDLKNGVTVYRNVSIDQQNGVNMGSIFVIKVSRINYSPVLGTMRVAKTVNPRFLKG